MIHNNLPNSPMMTLSHSQPSRNNSTIHKINNKLRNWSVRVFCSSSSGKSALHVSWRTDCPPCKHDGQTNLMWNSRILTQYSLTRMSTSVQEADRSSCSRSVCDVSSVRDELSTRWHHARCSKLSYPTTVWTFPGHRLQHFNTSLNLNHAHRGSLKWSIWRHRSD